MTTAAGIRFYADPFTALGRQLLSENGLEPQVVSTVRDNLREGDVFLDVGANEGFFSALAGKEVKRSGMVIAVEPQERLIDLIEINLLLNDVDNFAIFQAALGAEQGSKLSLNITPHLNSGASSFLWRTRVGSKSEAAQFVSPESILTKVGRGRFDLIKIDVEGYEPKIIDRLIPMISVGRIGKILVDYHTQITGLSAATEAHSKLLRSGMNATWFETPERPVGYVLYTSGMGDAVAKRLPGGTSALSRSGDPGGERN